MTWVFVPEPTDRDTGCHFVPGQEGSIWVSCSQSRDFTPDAGSSATNTRADASSRPSAQGISMPRQSGMTSQPSTAAHGAGSSTRSPRAIRASRSASQASAAEKTTNGTCGLMSPASSERSIQIGSSSKTSLATSHLAVRPCCESFGTWAARLRLAYSQRAKRMRRMKGNDCSSWPTEQAMTGGANSNRQARGAGGPDLQEVSQNWPTPMAGTPAQNGNSAAGNSDFSRRADQLSENLLSQVWPTATAKDADGSRSFDLAGNRILANAGPTLTDATMRWGTHRASDAEKGGPNQKFGAGGTPLPAQAAKWTTPSASDDRRAGTITDAMSGTSLVQQVNSHWPTPAARDYKGENGPDHLVNGSGRLHMDQLPNAVAYQFTPPGPGNFEGWRAVLRDRPDLAPAIGRRGIVRAARTIAAGILSTAAEPDAQPGALGVAHRAPEDGVDGPQGGVLDPSAIEPAIRRMAHGLAARALALRAIGNGVHPLAAAHAWRSLAAAHGLGPVDMEAASKNPTAAEADEPVWMMP